MSNFVSLAGEEPKCLYYGFSFSGNEVYCREGYEDSEGALAHLDNVGALLREALKLAELTRIDQDNTRVIAGTFDVLFPSVAGVKIKMKPPDQAKRMPEKTSNVADICLNWK